MMSEISGWKASLSGDFTLANERTRFCHDVFEALPDLRTLSLTSRLEYFILSAKNKDGELYGSRSVN